MAERAREARKALGDPFLASPRVALGAISDFCPDQPEQVALLARFLQAPGSSAILAALTNGALPTDAVEPHEMRWCKRLLAYACGITEDIPIFAPADQDASRPAAVSYQEYGARGKWVLAGVGSVIALIFVVLIVNHSGAKPPAAAVHPRPATGAIGAAIPDDRPAAGSAPPLPGYPSGLTGSQSVTYAPRPPSGRPRNRARPKASTGANLSPRRDRPGEPRARKVEDLRHRDVPPQESGE